MNKTTFVGVFLLGIALTFPNNALSAAAAPNTGLLQSSQGFMGNALTATALGISAGALVYGSLKAVCALAYWGKSCSKPSGSEQACLLKRKSEKCLAHSLAAFCVAGGSYGLTRMKVDSSHFIMHLDVGRIIEAAIRGFARNC
jgi:hypothetical protein